MSIKKHPFIEITQRGGLKGGSAALAHGTSARLPAERLEFIARGLYYGTTEEEPEPVKCSLSLPSAA